MILTKLFIYTDGVTEGYIDDNKTELGQQGVEDLVRKILITLLK